jgi:hypothetical protein
VFQPQGQDFLNAWQRADRQAQSKPPEWRAYWQRARAVRPTAFLLTAELMQALALLLKATSGRSIRSSKPSIHSRFLATALLLKQCSIHANDQTLKTTHPRRF